MKNYLLVFAVLCSTFAFAQDNEPEEDGPVNLKSINDKKHEFRIDVLESLALPALDISYEYVLSKYSGFGATVNIDLSDESDGYRQNYAITPYYRQYFFNKKDYGARGFFAEGLLQYAGGDSNELFDVFEGDDTAGRTESWSKFGVGFAIGQKWVSRNGFVLQISVGGGRYFGGNDDDFETPEGFGRGDISVGYRF